MTPREALEILYKGIAPNPTANNECIELCKKALEKQIAKKPKIYNNIYPKDLYECPLCECGLRANSNYKDNYCPKCGVKIDWSDT